MKINKLFTLFGLLAALALFSCPTPVPDPAPPKAGDTMINIAAIPGVTAPSFGATPVTTITPTAQYTGTVTWNGTPSTFAATTVYTATITLTAKAGYTLTGVAANSFTVAGATATNTVNSGVVTAVFPATGAAPVTVINIAAIPGVTAPAYGATPVTTITTTAQYTGTVTWNGTPSTFAASTVYTATITLTAKAGFTLTGVAANSFTVAGATATNSVNSGVVTAVFPATAAAVINIAAIPGVTTPVLGATPVTTITSTAQYTGTVTWNGTPSTFAASTVYTATITLTAKAGFTLTGVAANSFTVAGATATNSVNSGVVTAVFPATAAAVINITAIPGVTAPVTGATPVTTITSTAQYTGTVTWNGTPSTFAASTVYTATITLTAKAGYTLNGVAANSFTVAGASATNMMNSGVVTAVFPATAATVISITAIPGVTAPATGATPVTTITSTAQYTGTVTWSGTPSTFASSTMYTATITLTAKAGYTLTGVAANSFKVAGATAINPMNSGVVTAVFPATAAAVINMTAILGVTAPVYNETPVTTITQTVQYTGTISWDVTTSAFEPSTVYTATISLSAKAGYTLTGVAANSFTVAGATATNSVNSGVVTAVFPATAAAVINMIQILGLTTPLPGATPVTTITETQQYTGTVTWNGTPTTFEATTVYTAIITLTAKAGYTLTGVTADRFFVWGATSTNPANSGVVTVEFPPTIGLPVTDYTGTGVGTLKAVQGGNYKFYTTPMTVRSFRMSQYEVTRTQFQDIMNTDPSNTTYSSGTSDPVQRTNWYQAIAFCNKLSLAESLMPVYSVSGITDWASLSYASIPITSNTTWDAAVADWSANGYRLPTEAEWEFAAQGGNSTNHYLYPGSNTVGNVAVFGYNGSETGRTTTPRTNPVGSKMANELGLYDMSGNIEEWCWDWYDTYPATAQTDYRGATSGTYRVQHGGSWQDWPTPAHFRHFNYPFIQSNWVGFRVVRL